jgi:hypothetical protein
MGPSIFARPLLAIDWQWHYNTESSLEPQEAKVALT